MNIFIEINVENIDLKQSIKNTLNIYWLQVSEFLRMMMMFGGIGPGTPDVFRTINPDPHKVTFLFLSSSKMRFFTGFLDF